MAYRQLKIQKRVGGKLRRYKNLASFNKECPKSASARVHSESALCILDNVRELRDGSGLATVRIVPLATSGARKRGTWLLHFADHSMLKRHLKGRVDPARQGMLDGVRRRHRRK